MSHDIVNLPHTRNWRDIPQQVKPRAMSPGGRLRHTMDAVRVTAFIVVGLACAWGAWEVASALQENPKKMPAAARGVPVKHFKLQTDGVLDAAWVARMLALPKDASLMELDLQTLRARLLVDGQVSAASITRIFPDTLDVHLAEREPVARLCAQLTPGEPRILLVARDGVTFAGSGFSSARLDPLPWLDGVKLVRQNGRLAPIAGMEVAADLLARGRLETERLYATWQVVSLAKLESDDELEVRTKNGITIVFGAKGDFFPQLAKLDYQWDTLATATAPVAKIDLSLGREVPVTFATQTLPRGAVSLSHLPSKSKREL